MRRVTPEWQKRIFDMIQGWNDPGQIIPSDVERWHDILGQARAAITHEIVVGPSFLPDSAPTPTDGTEDERSPPRRPRLPTRGARPMPSEREGKGD